MAAGILDHLCSRDFAALRPERQFERAYCVACFSVSPLTSHCPLERAILSRARHIAIIFYSQARGEGSAPATLQDYQ